MIEWILYDHVLKFLLISSCIYSCCTLGSVVFLLVISRSLWFCIGTLCDWLKNLVPLSRPNRSKAKTNRNLLARVFPHLAPASCICFEVWLVHWIGCVCGDWSKWLLWFWVWFYNTQVKTTLCKSLGLPRISLIAFVWELRKWYSVIPKLAISWYWGYCNHQMTWNKRFKRHHKIPTPQHKS